MRRIPSGSLLLSLQTEFRVAVVDQVAAFFRYFDLESFLVGAGVVQTGAEVSFLLLQILAQFAVDRFDFPVHIVEFSVDAGTRRNYTRTESFRVIESVLKRQEKI